ncbi:MAG: hypothetical protein VXZ84_01605 [Planctomycetota bacterium]|nr:hypothetical protein [Planctomycetota bacterium]
MENKSVEGGEGSSKNSPKAQPLPESPDTGSAKQHESTEDLPESPTTKKHKIKIGSQRDNAEKTGTHGHHIS